MKAVRQSKKVENTKSKLKISKSELLIEGPEDLVKWGISVFAVLILIAFSVWLISSN